MATISNSNIVQDLAIIILTLAVLGAIGYFAVKEIRTPAGKNTPFPQEITIDTIEDARGLGYSGQRKMAEDDEGNIFFAYRKKFAGKSEIFVAKISGKLNPVIVENTDRPVVVVGSGTDQRVPSIATDSKGTVHVVWYGADNSKEEDNRQIKYSRSADSGTSWSSWRNIAFVSGYGNSEEFWQEHPSLAIGRDDALYAVWEGKDEKNKSQQIKFTKSTNGGNTWSYWKNIRVSENKTQSRPELVEDISGNLFVFMYSSLGGSGFQQINYSVSKDKGESWSHWIALSDPDSDSRHLSAARDNSGNMHLVWRQGKDGKPAQILYRKMEAAGDWNSPIAIAPSEHFQFFPSIGISGSAGNPIAVWQETADPSGFPQEDPRSGKVMASLFQDGKFSEPKTPSGALGGIYPNIPAFFPSNEKILVLYNEPKSGGNFSIKLKSLE